MLVERADLNYYPEEVIDVNVKEKQRVSRRNIKSKKRKKANARFKIFGIFMAVFLMSFCLFILLGYANISKVGFEINQLENQRNQLKSDKSALIADLEAVKASRKIADEASYKLGMVYPKEDQIVYVSVNDLKDATNNELVGREGLFKGVSKFLGLFSSLF